MNGPSESDFSSVRSMLQMSVLASLIATTAVTAYLGWQLRQVVREQESRQQALIQVRDNQKKMEEIAERFRAYGRTDSAFVSVLQRHGLTPADGGGSPVPTAPPKK